MNECTWTPADVKEILWVAGGVVLFLMIMWRLS